MTERQDGLDFARIRADMARNQYAEPEDTEALIVALEAARVELSAWRQHGPCICDTGPNTDGPQEFCPMHGRRYQDDVVDRACDQANTDRATIDTLTRERDEAAQLAGDRWGVLRSLRGQLDTATSRADQLAAQVSRARQVVGYGCDNCTAVRAILTTPSDAKSDAAGRDEGVETRDLLAFQAHAHARQLDERMALARRFETERNEARAAIQGISLMWAVRTSRGHQFLACTDDVPRMRELLAGHTHPDELPDPDDIDVDIEHLRLTDGRCVISVNGQGHLPCGEHAAGPAPDEPSPESIARIMSAADTWTGQIITNAQRVEGLEYDRAHLNRLAQKHFDRAKTAEDAIGRVEALSAHWAGSLATAHLSETLDVALAGPADATPAGEEEIRPHTAEEVAAARRMQQETQPSLAALHGFTEYGTTGTCGWILRHGGADPRGPVRCGWTTAEHLEPLLAPAGSDAAGDGETGRAGVSARLPSDPGAVNDG